jgi:hypothetical protein
VLAFEAAELKDLLCGPTEVQWTLQSLERTLRATGGGSFTDEASGEDTLLWLREALVGLAQPDRLR